MEDEFDPEEDLEQALKDEAEATRLAGPMRAKFFAVKPVTRSFRDVQVIAARPSADTSAGAAGTGRSLISRRPLERQRRYERIIAEELRAADRIDYKLQICCASAVFEEEIDALIAAPLRPHARVLSEVVRSTNDRDAGKAVEFLEKWGDGKAPTTLGLVGMGILRALREGVTRGDADLAPVLDSVFHPDFVEALRVIPIRSAFDWLKDIRNKSTHPGKEYTEAQYKEFVTRLVGHSHLGKWEEHGPTPATLDPKAGFLHRLLTGSKLLPAVDLPPAGGAVNQLTALATPRSEAFGLEIVPSTLQVEHRFRDVSLTAVRKEPVFKLGGDVIFQVKSDHDCHLTLIDIGTSGKMSLLLPNALCANPTLKAGKPAHFPGPEFVEFAFTLTGLTGRERLIAIATTRPLGGLPTATAGEVLATLTDSAISRIAQTVKALPGDQWSAAACEFTIEA